MNYLLIYLSGVVVAYFIIALLNDKQVYTNVNDDRVSMFFILFSWLVPIVGILIAIIAFLTSYYPTLKRRKN